MKSLNHPLSVHGHEVLNMIHASDGALTRQELIDRAHDRFGIDARFHTCRPGEMTLDQLLTFLLSRRKITEIDGRLRVVMENVCKDGQH